MAKLARKGKGELKLTITEANTKSGSIAIIGPCRLSYSSVFKTRMNDKRECKEYSAVLLIQKGDDEILDFVEERLKHALKTKFGRAIAKWDTCLKDGDEETTVVTKVVDGEEEEVEEPMYPGFMFISTRADEDQPPLLYGPDQHQLTAKDAISWVSGDWGYFKLDWFGFDNKNKGVSTRLKALQFSAKDEPFGKGGQDPDKVADEFGGVKGVDEASQGRGAGDDDDEGGGEAVATKKKKRFLD